MEQFEDIIFWKQVAFVAIILLLIIATIKWRSVWVHMRKAFFCDQYNMQIDYNDFYDRLKAKVNPSPAELELIHQGIESFREEHSRKVDPAVVASYVASLYNIHKTVKIPDMYISQDGVLVHADEGEL